jgi:hypothetical protein
MTRLKIGRPSESEREHAATEIRHALAEGRLTPAEAFDGLEEVYGAPSRALLDEALLKEPVRIRHRRRMIALGAGLSVASVGFGALVWQITGDGSGFFGAIGATVGILASELFRGRKRWPGIRS